MFMPVQIQLSVCNLFFCVSFYGEECIHSRLVSGRTSKHEWASVRVVMKSGFV